MLPALISSSYLQVFLISTRVQDRKLKQVRGQLKEEEEDVDEKDDKKDEDNKERNREKREEEVKKKNDI